MKFEYVKTGTADVSFIEIDATDDYDREEGDLPKGFAIKNGRLNIKVEADTGRIVEGFSAGPGMGGRFDGFKCVDRGTYRALAADGSVFGEIENDYVPAFVPGKYGDYIEFDVNDDGVIDQWSRHCNPENLRAAFFSDS